jgi:hypothetical protein
MGERLAIDPADNRTLYLGTRKNGLWRSTDQGATFAAQYNHDAGKRDARADGYVGQAGAFTVRGGFTSQ